MLGAAVAQSGPQGQDAGTQSPSQQVPLFRTQANLVLVDVVVRDHGKPVEGLKQADFQIAEDGKPQNISIFEEHRATDALQVAQAPALPPGEFSNDPSYTLTSAANVVLLDALNTPYSDQLYVRHRMLQFLKTIPPGTRVAVFTLSSRLRMVEGFSAGPDVLQKALNEKQSNPEVSPIMDPVLDQAMQNITDIAQGAGATGTVLASMQQFQQDQQRFQLDTRIQMTIDAMEELGRYLSTIPGRKNLIWFSGAFPPVTIGGGSQMGQAMEQSDFNEQIKKMNALLALARVSLYPVDARGLLQSSNFLAEANPVNPALLNSTPVGGGQATVSQNLNSQNASFLVENQAEHDLMNAVAKGTGGEAFVNTNALSEALGEAIANGSSYYTLGYTPENRNYNGDFRNVKVRLEGTHYDLQYRQGYYALSAAKQMALIPGAVNPLIAAMQRGAPELSEVLFRARVHPADAATVKTVAATAGAVGPDGAMASQLKNPARYVVDYWVHPERLEMSTLPDGRRQAKVELTEVVYNRLGIRQNYADTGLEVDLTPADAQQDQRDGIHLQQPIDVPAGEVMFLRLGVRDIASGRIGTLEMALNAGGSRN